MVENSLEEVQRDFLWRRAGALTCSGVESAATLCRLRQRDAHLARETLGPAAAASSSASSPAELARCFLARTPELMRRKIIHRDRFVTSIFFFLFFSSVASWSGAVETRMMRRGVIWWRSSSTSNYIAKGGARRSRRTQPGSGMLRGVGATSPALTLLNPPPVIYRHMYCKEEHRLKHLLSVINYLLWGSKGERWPNTGPNLYG